MRPGCAFSAFSQLVNESPNRWSMLLANLHKGRRSRVRVAEHPEVIAETARIVLLYDDH
jgi:hypothetical protein